MAIPDFQSLMLPLLQLAADGQEHSLAESRTPLAQQFGVTEEERKELLPSGQQPTFNNRVAWAKVYLERAGLLLSTRRAHFQISPRGREVLQRPPTRIDIPFLNGFSEFADFRAKAGPIGQDARSAHETPEETLQSAYQRIREMLAAELLDRVKAASPEFFERLVLDLMLKMGYGGSHDRPGSLTPAGADEGIDGIINEDRLGLDVIYLQAKRWENTIGRPEIQKFVGALHGRRAKKGVFLTTSRFSPEAIAYVTTIDPKIVLIDGCRLAQFMIDLNVGVSPMSPREVYEIKRIDADFFAEE
ncbi:MAG TPA: restriction endonuclease [Planctomycetaceae bacterium]|nr:restriction endonuclease [Planctomycetaceae bacterium]